jgi:hypothetical protein
MYLINNSMLLYIYIYIYALMIFINSLRMIKKHLESFEMWCWRRMEKISWTDHVRNEDVLLKSQGAEEYPT